MISYTITIEEKDGKLYITGRGDKQGTVSEAEIACGADLFTAVKEDIKIYRLAIQLAEQEQQLLKAKLN